MTSQLVASLKSKKPTTEHVVSVVIITVGLIIGGILTVLLRDTSYAVWQTIVGLAIAAGLAATAARFSGSLITSLIAGLSITAVPIHTSWTGAQHGGSTPLEELHVFIWTAWQYPVIFMPAVVVGVAVGAAWYAQTSDSHGRHWVLSWTAAAIALTALVWIIWFYWFDAHSLMTPGRPPA